MGDTKQMPRGCGPNIDGTAGNAYDRLKERGFGWPDNGEFEWGGRGDGCSLCPMVWDYGLECAGGIAGSRGKVKRKEFKADKDKCCLQNFKAAGSVKTVDGYTCDFDYRQPNSAHCTEVYRNLCKNGDNLINDEKCKSLENTNSTLHKQLMKDYCNKDQNFTKDSCINWCKSNSTDCTKINSLNDCVKYGICSDTKNCTNCTGERVNEIKNKCKERGMMSEQGYSIYPCSETAVEELEKNCKDAGVDLPYCSPISLQHALDQKNAEEQLRIQQEAMDQSQRNYEDTQNTIANVLGLEEEITPEKEQNSSWIIILIVVILLCVLLLSSSLLGVGVFVI